MTWLRDLLAHFTHPTDPRKADAERHRARRQWRAVAEAKKLEDAYRELDVVFKFDVRRKQ